MNCIIVSGELGLLAGDPLSEALVMLCLLMLGGVTGDPTLLHGTAAPYVGIGEASVLLEDDPHG
jgi:hypothetical protein